MGVREPLGMSVRCADAKTTWSPVATSCFYPRTTRYINPAPSSGGDEDGHVRRRDDADLLERFARAARVLIRRLAASLKHLREGMLGHRSFEASIARHRHARALIQRLDGAGEVAG